MPPKREHLRASRILLGTQTPVVHELLQLAVRRQGMEHSYLVSSLDSLGMIEALLGKEAKREATLHILQDWGIVTPEDVDHFSTFIPSRQKRAASSTQNRGKKKKAPKRRGQKLKSSADS